MPVPSQNKIILLIAEAIAHFEGFYIKNADGHPSKAKRNNNPGNLRGWDSSNEKDDGGFDIFEDRQAGFDALHRQVEKNIVERELSLQEFFGGKEGVYGGFAPDSDGNHSVKYAQFVVQFLMDRGFYPLSTIHQIKGWAQKEDVHFLPRPGMYQGEDIVGIKPGDFVVDAKVIDLTGKEVQIGNLVRWNEAVHIVVGLEDGDLLLSELAPWVKVQKIRTQIILA